MDIYSSFIPESLLIAGFAIAIISAVQSVYPIVPFRWVGWGKRNRKFNVKDWKGQDHCRLCDAAALMEHRIRRSL